MYRAKNPIEEPGYKYVDAFGIMVEHGHRWPPGDSATIHSYASLAYPDAGLKERLFSFLKPIKMIDRKKPHIQVLRHPSGCGDDTSRDQTIMILSAIKILYGRKKFAKYALDIPFRISRRFYMTPQLWLWIRGVAKNNGFVTFLYHLIELVVLSFSILWNKLSRKMAGLTKTYPYDQWLAVDPTKGYWDHYNQSDWKFIKPTDPDFGTWVNNSHKMYNAHLKKKEENKWYRFWQGCMFPDYALALTTWMIYCSKNTFLKGWIKKLLRWEIDEYNLLLQYLNGAKVNPDEYVATTGLHMLERNNEKCMRYKLKNDVNALDVDLLKKLMKK